MPEAGVPLVVLLHLSLDVVQGGLKVGRDFFPFLLLQTCSLHTFILRREKETHKRVGSHWRGSRLAEGLGVHLERTVVSLQLPAQTLQLAAGQDGLAVLVPEVIFVLDQLVLLLLQRSHLLLGVAVLLQLSQRQRRRSQ